jgi:hypothetical protein
VGEGTPLKFLALSFSIVLSASGCRVHVLFVMTAVGTESWNGSCSPLSGGLRLIPSPVETHRKGLLNNRNSDSAVTLLRQSSIFLMPLQWKCNTNFFLCVYAPNGRWVARRVAGAEGGQCCYLQSVTNKGI